MCSPLRLATSSSRPHASWQQFFGGDERKGERFGDCGGGFDLGAFHCLTQRKIVVSIDSYVVESVVKLLSN